MSEPKICPKCGGAIPEGSPEGQCPRCMLRAGLGEESSLAGAGHAFEGDRNLLFGVFAVQLRKVTPQEVMAAAGAWAADASKDIPTRLKEQAVLAQADVEFIARLVDEAVRAHGGDIEATLHTLGGDQVLQATFGNSIDLSRLGYRAAGSPVYLDGTIDPDSVPGVQETPGRYTHVSEHARGGMGRVLLVHDGFLGRNVALKELMPGQKPTSDPDNPSTPVRQYMGFLSRFLQEARITGQLEHPSIVPVYELGHRQDGTLYYTMKLVRGRTLREAINQSKSMQERLGLLAHFVDLCQAIAYAHSRGIIHRDIKPDNVMVGEFGETVVLDWGLAKAKNTDDVHADGLAETIRMLQLGDVDSALKTQYGQVMGTPGYMSPEQALGRMSEVDEKSDVYSLGAVLYQMLSGRPPFTGKSVQEILQKVVDDEPEGLDASTVPPELAAICMKAMAKRADDRYTSVSAMADEVRRFQTGAIVQAYSYGFAHHLKRFAKRHKAVLTTAAVAIFALIALTGYSYVNIHQARDVAEIKRAEAESQREEARNARAESDKRREAEEAARLAEEIARKKAEHNAYIAGIGLAKASLDVYNTASVRRNLMATPPHLRNWEWGYLYKAMDTSLFTLVGINRASYSPDGKRILTASNDTTAKVWDSETGAMLILLSGHIGNVNDARYAEDGKRILTASNDMTAKIWDAESGSNILTLTGHREAVRFAVFSPNGSEILTASDTAIKLWNASTGEELHTVPWRPTWVGDVGFSPDGNRVFAASDRHEDRASVAYVHVWDTETGEELFTKSLGTIASAASFGPSGDSIITKVIPFALAGGDKLDQDAVGVVWDIQSGQPRLTLTPSQLPLIYGHPRDISFSADGSQIVTAGEGGTSNVWDAETGKEKYPLIGHDLQANSAEFSADGKHIVTASDDTTAKLWNTEYSFDIHTMQGHTLSVRRASFGPDARRVLTYSEDGTAKVWDTLGPPVQLEGLSDSYSLFFSPDGTRVCGFESRGLTACIWDARTGRRILEFTGHTGAVIRSALSKDGALVATASEDGTARIWDAVSGSELRKLNGQFSDIDVLYFSKDGRFVIAWSGRTKRIWDVQTGQEIVVPGFEELSPDGKKVLTYVQDGTLKVLSLETREVLLELELQSDKLVSVCFSPDGNKICTTAGWDAPMEVWDSVSGQRLFDIPVHAYSLFYADITEDSKRICGPVTGNEARVWDAHTGEELLSLIGHTDGVNCARFSPDGTRILTVSEDSTARVWDAKSGDELLSLPLQAAVSESWGMFSPDGRNILTTCLFDGSASIWSAVPWRPEDWLDDGMRTELVRLALRNAPEVHETTLDRSKGEVEPVLTALETFAGSLITASAKTPPALRAIKDQGIYFSEAPATTVTGITLNAEDVVVNVDGYVLVSVEELAKRITDFVAAARAEPVKAHTLTLDVVNRYDRDQYAITVPAASPAQGG